MTEAEFAERCVTTFNGEIKKYFDGNENCLGANYVEVLEKMGYWFKTVKVWNSEVMAELAGVVDAYRCSPHRLFVPEELDSLNDNLQVYSTFIDVVPTKESI